MTALAYRELVIEAFRATLQAIPGISRVYRNRTRAVSAWPAIVIYEAGQGAPIQSTGETRYRLEVEVECHVAGGSDEELGPAASELYALVLEATQADPSLGGLCSDVEEGEMSPLDPANAEGSAPAASFTVSFILDFATQAGRPRLGA